MLIRLLFLLILLADTANGLTCLNEFYMEISLEYLTHESFKEEFDYQMSSVETDIWTNAILCGFSISVDYTNEVLIIEIDPGFALEEANIEDLAVLYTTFKRAPNREIVSDLFIRCSSKDKCDENFIFAESYEQWWWMIDEIDHIKIYQMFDQLFDNDNVNPGPVQCYNKYVLETCNSKVCHARSNIQDTNFTGSCLESSSRTLRLFIRTTFANSSNTTNIFDHSIEYTCSFDACNSEFIHQKAHNIINTYYDVSPMKRVFNGKLAQTFSTTLISTKFTTAPTMVESTSTVVPTIVGSASTTVAKTVKSTSTSLSLSSTTNSSESQLKTSTILIITIFLLFAALCF